MDGSQWNQHDQGAIKVVATDSLGNTGFDVSAQNFMIDTIAPAIDFGFDYEYDQRISALPSEIVDLGSVTLTNLTDGTILTGSDLTIIEGDVTILIKNANGLLSNGNWKLTGPGATDSGGNQSDPMNLISLYWPVTPIVIAWSISMTF